MAELRVTHPVSLQQNLQTSEYQARQAQGTNPGALGELLPAGTTVSEEIRQVFDQGQNVDAQLMAEVVASCADPELRQPAKFNAALRRTAARLKKGGTAEGRAAARVLDELQQDQDLLANYRATLLD